ncbi:MULTISPECIES: zeta toxin family protein [Mycolicibacter]|uniref:ATPase n=1 Tax=Mycolicibacter virginiensis TaxID=1795032 RepID=A0A9X7IJP9_9MYCO|nr:MULTISPECIES: AAA family ATPase [Mycobacteriaceae]OBG34740.1 ATPase [Mycolicibacter heraklionensis]OBJ29309.1 ATPase [Mycolicibacter heraklionensis]PQM50371.1 ATPase [Mycolicibacter virginiensis]ULP49865.1 zeta toxin family protein [Mycolicibacter virginiensis]
MRRLDLVVGPNGAGKSTFVALTLAPLLPGVPFVNADEIAKNRWPDEAAAHAYDAARLAAQTRMKLIEAGRSFIAETVFSHESKIELIRTADAHDYTVVLHAVLIPEALAIHRVRYRVAAGGHTVPEGKIRERYHRLWPLVAEAIGMVDVATVYENSRAAGPKIVAQFAGGAPIGELSWPAWAPDALVTRWRA